VFKQSAVDGSGAGGIGSGSGSTNGARMPVLMGNAWIKLGLLSELINQCVGIYHHNTTKSIR
jgi:hypothetical protein